MSGYRWLMQNLQEKYSPERLRDLSLYFSRKDYESLYHEITDLAGKSTNAEIATIGGFPVIVSSAVPPTKVLVAGTLKDGTRGIVAIIDLAPRSNEVPASGR